MTSGKWDTLVTVVTKHTFEWSVDKRSGEAKPMNYFPKNRPRRQDWDGHMMENGAFYMFTRKIWLKEHCRLAGRITYHEMPPYTEVELDNPYELPLLVALVPQFAYRPPFLGSIKLLVLDFDGVLTGCQKIYSTSGEYLKVFNMRDGHGVSLIRKAGIEVKIITRSVLDPITVRRCKDLNIQADNIMSGVLDKGPDFKKLLEDGKYNAQEVAYMGDDIIDLDCLKMVGFPACPLDAHESIKGYCRFVSHYKGGQGAVRELCDYILGLLGSTKKKKSSLIEE
jgi:YrbI family 3-deoxy-D-manno-octulosonate 8-phosphate phosphatase